MNAKPVDGDEGWRLIPAKAPTLAEKTSVWDEVIVAIQGSLAPDRELQAIETRRQQWQALDQQTTNGEVGLGRERLRLILDVMESGEWLDHDAWAWLAQALHDIMHGDDPAIALDTKKARGNPRDASQSSESHRIATAVWFANRINKLPLTKQGCGRGKKKRETAFEAVARQERKSTHRVRRIWESFGRAVAEQEEARLAPPLNQE